MTVTEHTFAESAATMYRILTDPTTYPEWLVGAKEIRDVSQDWPAVGSSFEHTVGFGPLQIPDKSVVFAIEPSRSLTLTVKVRPVLEARVKLEVLDNGSGSLVRMSEEPVGVYTVIAPLARPLIRARNKRSLDRLADHVARVNDRPADPSSR